MRPMGAAPGSRLAMMGDRRGITVLFVWFAVGAVNLIRARSHDPLAPPQTS
jgi:hypothetical protein